METDITCLGIISNMPINTHVDIIRFHCCSEIREPEKLLLRALKYCGCRREDNLVEHGKFKGRSLHLHSENTKSIRQ